MAANTFGEMFRVTTCGESHGEAIGCIIDGCPPGLTLTEADIQVELDRRRPGQSEVTTPRREGDRIAISAGVFEGRTTGAPILLLTRNEEARPSDYEALRDVYRPSHGDFTWDKKFGRRDWRGGGRSSARETVARVAAGAVAQKYLREACGLEIVAWVEQVGSICAEVDRTTVSRTAVDTSVVRCPVPTCASRMIDLIRQVREAGDSIGGVIGCVIRNVPAGLGEPVFDKLPAVLGHAMLSINAVKGFEIGEGFAAAERRGSEHNDPFIAGAAGPRPATNRAGGVLGGISTGEEIFFRVAFKPVATIRQPQASVRVTGEAVTLEAAGRHDPCVVPRAVPIVEGMAALVLIDQLLRFRAQCSPAAGAVSPG